MSTPMSRARLARLRVYTSTSPLESSPRPHSTPPTSPCTYLHDIYAISTLYLRYIYTPSVSTSLSSSPCLAVAGARAGSSCWHSATLSASNSYPRARQKLACSTVQYSTVQYSTLQFSTVQHLPGWRRGRCRGLAGCGTSSESPPRSGSSPPAPRARPPPPPCSAMFWLDVRLDRYRYYISRPRLHCMLSQASCLHASWLVSAQPGARLFSQNQAAQR